MNSLTILVKKDTQIDDKDFLKVASNLSRFYSKNANIKLEWKIEDHNYTNAEASTTVGIFDTLSERYLRNECAKVYKKHAEAVDHVIFLIHEDKFNFGRIWGENFSNHFSGYQTEVCRWDKDNWINSTKTIYHEMHHAHEAFIYKYTGNNIDRMLGYDWDDMITHGGGSRWLYIGRAENGANLENAESLIYISDMLQQAVNNRRKVWTDKKTKYLSIITLAKQLVYLLRERKKTT